ncbi:MAG: ribonucleoside-diphosphate reductase subunit alpha, partial [Gammaproteobacteria bacterium]|nr:ribonucleoside-diphosphate reductase subunit alpha [Gammaproteobacteria bacterium]
MQNIESPLTGAPEASVRSIGKVTEEINSSLCTNYNIVRRNGKLTGFDKNKIAVAMTKAFLAVEGGQAAASTRVHETVEKLTDLVVNALTRRQPGGGTFHIEDIQDQVELAMMRNGDQKIARAYVLYREQRTIARALERTEKPEIQAVDEITDLHVKLKDGSTIALDTKRLKTIINDACTGLESTDAERVYAETMKNLFDGVPAKDVSPTVVMSARGLIDNEPEYSQVTARLLLDELRTESLTFINDGIPTATYEEMIQRYPEYFGHYIKKATDLELLDKELLKFDLKKLGKALKPQRDHAFTYLGLQTLYDRYFIHYHDLRFELPQAFFMRVAMGLAINEVNREERAIEFYSLLSSFDFMSSTPTLFNSGTLRPQLSSCYLTTIPDDLDGIFSAIKDDAMLSKFAGGLGNDWTRVRAMGSHIKGTNGKSQGVVPFMKVANDTAVAVNQGGKRKGAMCAYLETWHLDIEDFLDLRKNTGEERRRTHDMNTANWIPDLFMKRVAEEQQWTLFSPDEVPDLHELYGLEFETAYLAYEAKADRGEISCYRRIAAIDLWRKMLGMLFETGHPWITFKDPCNIRSPQQHSGVVHSSNLCTEITLNTSDTEIAVCNLGSVNLPQHVDENGLNLEKLEKTINTAMRMLDNVIDYNYYSVPQARTSNLRHRPVGLGIMGFQDALYIQHIPYSSEQAIDFADQSMEAVSYYTIQASTQLAEERGAYSTYQGSLWSQGILPIDSIANLKAVRGDYLQQDTSSCMNWDSLRQRVMSIGMRNSNTMSIAPTATISNICGVSQSIEPIYQNLYVKSNLSGEFTVVNPYLVDDLKAHGVWDDVMVNDLK